ncbi:MAG TPA: CoA pyrophosphatase [Jatrophihabitantaceae bacterium]|jgi:8-oxo-dGTP pyrophosphatase MutT (NUDIX family)
MTEMLPAWLHPLVDSVAALTFADLSRYGPPEDGSGRESAVLIALAETVDGPGVLLLERAATLRTHAGQVAFPGGAADPGEDPATTALREAHEEVGLDPASVQVVATFPALFLPPSGFVVTPVLAWWRAPHPVRAVAASEVAGVAVVPVRELADPANRFRVRHPSGFRGPGFEAGGMFIWGFTAGLLDALLVRGGWGRDWDETVVRDLPTHRVP